MATYIEESEAHKYSCCAMPMKCTGTECMAWKTVYVYSDTQIKYLKLRTGMSALMPIAPEQRTTKGYCGKVK